MLLIKKEKNGSQRQNRIRMTNILPFFQSIILFFSNHQPLLSLGIPLLPLATQCIEAIVSSTNIRLD